jgi:hypothetical protein
MSVENSNAIEFHDILDKLQGTKRIEISRIDGWFSYRDETCVFKAYKIASQRIIRIDISKGPF